jgi:hypothetical protein
VADIHGRPLDFTQGRTLSTNRGALATIGALRDSFIEIIESL